MLVSPALRALWRQIETPGRPDAICIEFLIQDDTHNVADVHLCASRVVGLNVPVVRGHLLGDNSGG